MPNVYAVLHRLRDATDVVVLWIDGLCIDQNNTEERTHQVGMMRDIYANSTEVIIWLGRKTDVSNQPMIEFWGDDRDVHHIRNHLIRCNEEQLNCFSLVGDAYVHGIMDGNLASGDSTANLTATTPVYLV